jgi:hypothetical protein
MKRSLCALALALALGCSVLAREIPTPPAPQPPPQTTQQPTTEGEIHTPGLAELVVTLFALF